jgi:hypothetical protein
MRKSAGEDYELNLIKLNNLQYETPESMSVVISKQFKFFSADKTSYGPTDTIMATLSTGQQYVDVNDSYFSFDFKAGNVFPGNALSPTEGGVTYPTLQHIMQLFKHIRITHFSGTVVWEDQHFGQHWLQDRVFEIPEEKLRQELQQAKGQTSNPILRPYFDKLRRPGVMCNDFSTNHNVTEAEAKTYGVEWGGDVNNYYKHFPSIAKIEETRRNLPYYTIQPINGSETQMSLGMLDFPDKNAYNDYMNSSDTTRREQRLMLNWANYPKGRWCLPLTQNQTDHTVKGNTTITYHIPFHWIPFFKHDQNSLMPSMLANGLRIEFILGGFYDLFCQAFDYNTTGVRPAKCVNATYFEITRFRSNLQLVDLTPRIYALLLQDSINGGLNWVVDCTYTTMQQSVASSFQIECTRALSRVKMVKAIPYWQKCLNAPPVLTDDTLGKAEKGGSVSHFSYASANCGFARWRFTLGSMSYPAQDCEEYLDTGVQTLCPSGYNNKSETYAQILNAYGYNEQRGDDACLINFDDFCHSGIYQACVSLERSPNMQQSGLSLSTDASLRFIATLGQMNNGLSTSSPDLVTPVAVYVFVTYTSTVLIIGDKVIVKN